MSFLNHCGPSLRRISLTTRLTRARPNRIDAYTAPFPAQWRFQHNQRKRPLRVQPRPPPTPKPQHHEAQIVDEIGAADATTVPEFPKVKVRYLRPAVWALTVSFGIFSGLAYLEANQQLKDRQTKKRTPWPQVPKIQFSIPRQSGPPTPTEVATNWWTSLNGASKLSMGLVGINTAVHAGSFIMPRFWYTLWHLPARNVNYTQFTSMFVHSGVMHIAFNMYALANFMPVAGNTKLFEGNAHHLLAFYLSTGVLSGFAQHLATLIPAVGARKLVPEIFVRCGGASGALFGILSVFCMQYPTAGLGLMFIPGSMEAQYFLPLVMLFDFVGMVRGYSFISLGHAAHLSGATMGIVYSHFDGKTNLWNPLVRFWKRRLQA